MALFPKNVVFRHSGNTFNGLKSYLAANPDEALTTGEIFVKYDSLDPSYASILTQDPRFNEPVSVFGNITQLIGVPTSRRVWPYLSTIIYRDSRIVEDFIEGQLSYDPPRFKDAGPGWDITNPFPYDLSKSILNELGDVATEEQILTTDGYLRSIQEGDTLNWVWIIGPEQTSEEDDWIGYFQAGPGLGQLQDGITGSAKLNDTLSATYPGGAAAIQNNASLRWSQRDLQWMPKPVFPFLEGRDDVTYGEDNEFLPEDGDGLKYDAVNAIWKPGDPVSDGVVKISDARRGTRDLEVVIITGQAQGWDTDRSQYLEAQTSWKSPSTEINPLRKKYELSSNCVIRTKEGSPNDYWERFEDGAFYIPQGSPIERGGSRGSYIVPLTSSIFFPEVEYNDKWEKGTGAYDLMTPPNLSAKLGALAPKWFGDVTTQFWCKFNDELYDVDIVNDSPFSNPVRFGDRFYFLKQDRISFWLQYTGQGLLGGQFSLYCDYDANGSRPGLLIEQVATGVDYHICFTWDALAKRYKAWLNGVLVAQVESRALGSEISFNPDDIVIGSDSNGYVPPSMWLADFVTTLTAEHSKDFVAIFSGERDFNPPGPWGRKIVEGPKAALSTLGITDTGYFSWVSKEVPYKWNTAFGENQRFWIQEQLGWDASYFRGGEVLGWKDGRLATIPNAGGSDTKAKYSPGPIPKAPWQYSQIFNPEDPYQFQDPATGSFSPSLRFTNGKGINWRGTSWGYRYDTDTYSRPSGRGTADFSMLGTPYISSKFQGKGGIYPSPVSNALGGINTVWDQSSGWNSINEFRTGSSELNDLFQEQTYVGFNGTVIKFHVYDLASVNYIFGGPSSDDNTLRLQTGPSGRVSVYLRHYQPWNTQSSEGTYDNFAWFDGFRDYVFFETKPGLIKNDSDHEIAIIQDFKNGELSLYVDKKKEDLYNVSPATGAYLIGDINDEGPGETTDENLRTIWCPDATRQGSAYPNRSWRNKNLPRSLSIQTGQYQAPDRPLVRTSIWAGGKIASGSQILVQGFAITWNMPDGFVAQDYYDFKDWYDIEAQHVGQTHWTGAAHARQQQPSFFQVSDLETTNAETKAAQLNGHFVGAGRSINSIALDLDDRYSDRNGFFRLDLQQEREEYARSNWYEGEILNWSPGTYYASGKQVSDSRSYFTDVKSTATQWKTGDALTFRSGFWIAQAVDDTSTYNLADNEPVRKPFADGQILVYNEGLAGYKNISPSDFTYELDEISDVVITSPSSNDQLFYDTLTSSWSNKDLYYIESVIGLADVNIDPKTREETALLGWNEVEKSYVNKYATTIVELTDLEDVYSEMQGQSGTYYLAWNNGSNRLNPYQMWDAISDGSDHYQWRGTEGHWHTINQDDYNVQRKLGRVLGVGDNLDPVGLYNDYDGDFRFLPLAFVETYQDSVNTGRGDGGNFEYGDIDMGMPLAIYGGGNFETGLEDAPREMIEGLDGGEFYLDNRRAMDVPTMRGYQYDPTELILYFDGAKPFMDSSLRVGQNLEYEGELVGDASINTTDGIVEYPTFYWTERYSPRTDRGWPEVPLYKGGQAEAKYLVGTKLWLRNEPWSVEFDVRMDQPDTHDFVFFTKGNSDIKLSYEQRNWATMTEWEYNRYKDSESLPTPDRMLFSWRIESGSEYVIPMSVAVAPWVYGEFRHFVLAYAPDPGQISVYYNEILVCTGLLTDARRDPPYLASTIQTEMVNRDWRNLDWANEYFGFGCDPTDIKDHLQGAIDNVRIMQHQTPYDATSGVAPVATIPYPLNELPPAFDPSLSLAENNAQVVAMIEFEHGGDLYSANGLAGVDSVGRLWEPNPFSVNANEVTDPYNESVPYVMVDPSAPGYQIDSKRQAGYFENRTSGYDNGWNGRCGLKTTLTPELDLRDKSFAIDTVIDVFRSNFWGLADIRKDTALTKELVEHSLILLNVAAEEDLSDVESGRSWALRVLDFSPNSRYFNKEYDKGIRFEWWREDEGGRVQYHNLDFWFGPECFSAITAERKTEGRPGYVHLVVQRDMTEGSMSVILNGARIKKFHPMLKESFRDVTSFLNPLMALGIDANMNFDEGFDFYGHVDYLRILTGTIPWGQTAEFPYTKPDLSAN